MNWIKRVKNSSVAIYSLIFAVCSLLFSIYFMIEHKSFIWARDGIFQHYAILYDFNEIMRNFFSKPLAGFSEWSFNIGYGADIIGTYSYYVLGDPFAYISLLFPMDKLELAFNILVIVRLYFAGLSFMLYAKKMNFSKNARILGSVSYSFSSFIMLEAIRHPYFINPLIILPLAFICIENMLKNEKKYLFSIIVAVAMVSNFYFCYMIAILTVIYALIRFWDCSDEYGIKFGEYFKNLFIYFIIGILISSVILLPTIYFIISSSRSSVNLSEIFRVLYSPGYYSNLIFTSISTGPTPSWSIITSPILVFIFLPLFIRVRNRYKTYFYMLIIFIIMVLIPAFGLAMNGFSSISNRWTLIFAFMASIIMCVGFDNLNIIEKQDIRRSIYILVFYILISIVPLVLPNIKGVFIPIVMLGILALCIIKLYCKNRNIQLCFYLMLSILVINIGINCFYRYSNNGFAYIEEFKESGTAKSYYDNAFNGEDKYIKIKDNSFYRIGKVYGVSRDKTRNNSIVENYNGIDSYLSVTNGNMADLSKELGNRSFTPNSPIINFDNRPIITDILGVKYLIAKDDKPFNLDDSMEKIHDNGKYSTYENKNVLPFGYVYSNIISEEEFDKLNSLQKEESLVYSASVNSKYLKPTGNINESKIKEIPFNTDKSTVKVKDNEVIVTKKNQELVLNADYIKGGNLYVRISNLKFIPTPYSKTLNKEVEALGKDKSLMDILKIKGKILSRFGEGKGFKISVCYDNLNKSYSQADISDASAYRRMDDILFNLGYFKNDEKNKTIKIKFSNPGKYTFDSIQIYNLPTDKYDSDLDKLRDNAMNLESIANDRIIGNIDTKVSGVLAFQIPYSKGWTVKIDGNKVQAFPVNTGFLGTNITKGKHKIELEYRTPFLNLGVILSLFGIVMLILSVIFDKKYSKSRRK